jgi:hypothetical protein
VNEGRDRLALEGEEKLLGQPAIAKDSAGERDARRRDATHERHGGLDDGPVEGERQGLRALARESPRDERPNSRSPIDAQRFAVDQGVR